MRRLLQFILVVLLFALQTAAQEPATVRFVRNQGQWEAAVRYRADIPGGYLLLKNSSLCYVFFDQESLRPAHAQNQKQANLRQAEHTVRGHAVEVAIEGANPTSQIEEQHPNAATFNYFLGNDPAHWASNVASFGEVIYHDIYPDIDLKLYAFRQTLKYEFIAKPRADVSQIKLRYEGSSGLKITDNQLQIQTTVNQFGEQKPYTFQEINGRTLDIPTNYQLEGNVVSFNFPKKYSADYELTIDPELVFSTYSGSIANNFGHAATYDEQGNLYTAGTIHTTGAFPTTTGAFQQQQSGGVDIGILKFSSDGTKLLYGTYIGGNATDLPHSMIVNSKNELVIFGTTSSTNFPTKAGAYQTRFAGGRDVTPIGGFRFVNGSDIFVLKLNATGSTLEASTLVGGTGNDGISQTEDFTLRNYGDEFRGEVVVDDKDNIYVATSTNSSNFPLVNPISATANGRQDAVVFKLNSTLTGLLSSTYLGGRNSDAAYGIKWAPSGAVYVTGVTRSENLPVKTGSFKNIISGQEDAFVAKFTNDRLEQLTYVGTDSAEVAYLLDVDAAENVHLFGLTRGKYPTTTGVYSTLNGGQFVHAFDKSLSKTVFSTAFGSPRGRPDISPTAFLVNECGNIYLAGWGGAVNTNNGYNPFSGTTGLPTTPDALRRTTTGHNFYVAILEKEARSLLYATFFGSSTFISDGDHVDGGTSRFAKNGVIYHATCVCRTANFPTTPNVWSPNKASSDCNNAAFKINIDRLRANFDSYEGQKKDVLTGCAPLTLNFLNTSEGGKTYTWDVQGNVISRDATQATYTFPEPGEYKVTLRAFNPLVCRGQDVVTKIVKVGRSKAKALGDTTVCSNVAVQLKAEGGIKYLWSPAAGLSNPNVANPVARVAATTQFTVQVTDSVCSVSRSVTVRINNDKPDFRAFRDTTICFGQSAILTAQGNSNRFRWRPSATLSDSLGQRVVAKPTQTTVYTVEGIYADGCRPTKQITVRVEDSKLSFRTSPDTTICEGQSALLLAIGGTSYRWNPPSTLSDSTVRNPVAKPRQTTTYTVFATYPDGCQTSRKITVTVEKPPQLVDFEAIPAYSCGEVTTFQLASKSSAEAVRFEWIFDDNSRQVTSGPLSYEFKQSGVYPVTLRASSRNGCFNSVTKNVPVGNLNQVPNVITPNGDGKNDRFVLGIKDLKLEIANRWGRIVFSTDSYADDWGAGVANGTYFYAMTLPGGGICKGWVQVLE
ncbi:MAG: PKD domain-containing protein [Cytophagia bacterium]|nr:MAG: PKD domain-containing protein [Runella sp.]TAG17387.1 MAG: PKD domain-containing protein [Cytophagales bacterium]TAG36388.1 MAG: PKD domain-containing protein [Cytophagia bacterium]TAG51931.1 MAG: PKD domain-containing protein [Runella slithyformis]TAG77947.1 MAG: PKD domain-containing protein [Cytophagales bacterium]